MTIPIPPILSSHDRIRWDALAKALEGRYSKSPEAHHFTPERGRKFQLLFDHGFSVLPTTRGLFFTHPKTLRRLPLHEAVRLARFMEPAVVEEAP